MLLVLPLVAGVIAGLVLRGSLRSLAETPIRFGWVFLLGLGIQLALFTPLTDSQHWDLAYGHVFYVASLLLVLSALILNARTLEWPLWIMIAGAVCNLAVIIANGGAMPVNAHLLAQAQGVDVVNGIVRHQFASNVSPMTGSTMFPFLGDHIRIAAGVYSLGDIVLGVGVFLVAIFQMNRKGWAVMSRLGRVHKPSSLTQVA
jgi:hypothetical protein